MSQYENTEPIGPGAVPAEPARARAGDGVAAQEDVHGGSYLQFLWRQFRDDTAAVVALWSLVVLFLIAVFAPLIASNQPFVFYDRGAAGLLGGTYLVRLELTGLDETKCVVEPRAGLRIR